MSSNDFAVFILSHGRPDRVRTVKTLAKFGYTGKIFIILDDLDKARDEYERLYPNQVIVFNKKESEKLFDPGDNFKTYRGVIYARNACFEIAKSLGIKYFLQLDDDYREFKFRFNESCVYKPKNIRVLDKVFSHLLEFFISTEAVTLTFAQGGDFIGGSENRRAKSILLERKAMNSFFCSTDRPFTFDGRINEDVNAYVSHGSRGKLFFMTNQLTLEQVQTQSNSGGMTGLYLDHGTYVKSFYSVMIHPSGVKVRPLRDRLDARLHHSVSWNNVCPKIIRQEHKKSANI